MPLQKKTFLLLAFSCLVLAISIFLFSISEARGKILVKQRAMLANAEIEIGQLRRDVERYESTRSQLKKGEGGDIARHEKVAISSTFTPAELPRINDLFEHAYDTDGFLLLRNFSLRWTESVGDQNTTSSEATLALSIFGEKIFTQ